jgi:hypothetical protein
MGQFTIIITRNIKQAARQIRNNRNDLEQSTAPYLITEGGHKILLKPPRYDEIKEYFPDVIINETKATKISELLEKPEAVIINTESENE